MVGRQEVRGSIVGGVVDECTGAHGEATLNDQGHAALFGGPSGPFRTVDVDVAVSAVAKGTAVFAVGPAAEGAVALDHLVDRQVGHLRHLNGLAVFDDHAFRRQKSSRQSAPVFHVAVVEGANEVAAVGRGKKQCSALGHAKRIEPDRHACGSFGFQSQAPDAVSLFDAPRAMFHCVELDVVLDPKPPRRLFETVRDVVFGLKRGTVNGGQGDNVLIPRGRPRAAAVCDLGLSRGRCQQGNDGKEGEKTGHACGFNGRCKAGLGPMIRGSGWWCRAGCLEKE